MPSPAQGVDLLNTPVEHFALFRIRIRGKTFVAVAMFTTGPRGFISLDLSESL